MRSEIGSKISSPVDVPMNNFIRKAMQNVILGFVKTLKGADEARKVELTFEVTDNE